MQRASRPGGKEVDAGSGTDQQERRDEQAELNKGPLISRRVATRALLWSGVLQVYEVLSNMLSLPGWAWGIAGFAVTAPEVASRTKDAFKSWRGKR